MIKQVFQQIDLTCMMQEAASQNVVCKGVMSINSSNGLFRFEEAVASNGNTLNPKLYKGKYVSLVHMKNGKYQLHLRVLEATPEMDCQSLANDIRNEISEALKVMI